MDGIIGLLIVIALFFLLRNNDLVRRYSSAKRLFAPKYRLPGIGIRDKGKYGEYFTYKRLKHFEETGAKFLFNLYISRNDNKGTVEIDILMICSKGIFVFEVKNYGGWIFGSEKRKMWCQIFPRGYGRSYRNYFYNPIWQNASHIKHLKSLLKEKLNYFSVIVFSDDCTFKQLEISDTATLRVVYYQNIVIAVEKFLDKIQEEVLSENKIDEIYNKLYPYSQNDAETELQHIENIYKNKFKKQEI